MEQDEGFARRALRLLDEEPDWPSLVNIERAVADGRRLERRRTAVRVGAATVAVGLVAGGVGAAVALGNRAGPDLIAVPPTGRASADPSAAASVAGQAPPAPTSCAVHPLPVPQWAKTVRVMGGDPTGRYLVGSAVDGGGRRHALLWTDGDLRVLDGADATADVDGIAVNASGTAVWSAGPSAYVYRDGKVSPLPAANGYHVMRIDPTGDVYALDERDVYRGPPASGAPGTRPGNGAQRLLTVSAGGSSSVRDLQRDDTLGSGAVLAVDDDGTAVGLAAVGSGPIGYGNSHAAAWHAGTMTVLMPPDAGYAARPVAIADGWIGGESWSLAGRTPDATTGSLPGTGVRWNLRTGAAERIPGLSRVTSINRYGWVVGQAPDGRSVAAFGDRVVKLPDPAGADPNAANGSMVTTVSDDGRVVAGEAFLRADGPTPVRWTCD